MPRFRKKLLKAGKYLVNTMDGQRTEENFPPERLKKMADSFSQMKESGLNVPAPWWHDQNEAVSLKQQLVNSKNNAGWWDLFIDPDGDLAGEIDVPLEEDAKRIGTTVKEVSPIIRKKFIDGTGRIWEDVITQGALVTHPVQPGQDEFKPITSQEGTAIAMSCYLGLDTEPSKTSDKPGDKAGDTDTMKSDPVDGAGDQKSGAYGIKDAIKCLRGSGIDLPDDTTPINLIERIIVACRAIQGKEREDDEELQEGESKYGTEQPQPIAMSTDMPADQIKQIESLKTLATTSVLNGHIARVHALVSSGRVSKAYAKEHLEPLFQGFQLSLDDEGQPLPSNLDLVLNTLEGLPPSGFLGDPASVQPAQVGAGSKLSLFEEELPADMMGEGIVSEGQDLDSLAQAQIAAAGY